MSHNICTFFDILLIIAANVIKSNDYSDFITRFVRPAGFSLSMGGGVWDRYYVRAFSLYKRNPPVVAGG